jgi:hypothetical protein
MSFSTDLAALVANQLSRFVTLNPHQLAGQVGNLDFWLDQVRHALAAIDGYGVRFIRMEGAQERYVTTHGTTESSLDHDHPVERKAPPPHRIPDRDLQKARRALTDAAIHFLERCQAEGLISEPDVDTAFDRLGLQHRRR